MLFCEPKIPKYTDRASGQSVLSTFSALLRAENSEMPPPEKFPVQISELSVLFCEPKIPKSKYSRISRLHCDLSVLFCEPKIPKYSSRLDLGLSWPAFSALLRAENSEIFPASIACAHARALSVLFCEPKIPKCTHTGVAGSIFDSFSALLRAENSEMLLRRRRRRCE